MECFKIVFRFFFLIRQYIFSFFNDFFPFFRMAELAWMVSTNILANVPQNIVENSVKLSQWWPICINKLPHVHIMIANMEFVSNQQEEMITSVNVHQDTQVTHKNFYLLCHRGSHNTSNTIPNSIFSGSVEYAVSNNLFV